MWPSFKKNISWQPGITSEPPCFQVKHTQLYLNCSWFPNLLPFQYTASRHVTACLHLSQRMASRTGHSFLDDVWPQQNRVVSFASLDLDANYLLGLLVSKQSKYCLYPYQIMKPDSPSSCCCSPSLSSGQISIHQPKLRLQGVDDVTVKWCRWKTFIIIPNVDPSH